MEIINPEHNTTISEFYNGKNVFVTGATGFMGKALIDKLLRSCPDIGNIYILVRPKKEKDLKERIEHMLKDLLFDTLKQTAPSQLTKLIPLHGDCGQLNLGLSEVDYKTITSSVSVIYHVAASVRFDDALKYAILLNTRGTRELALLALQTTHLSVLVHVSTTYCNCVIGKKIKEQFYPPPDDWRKAIQIAEEFDEDYFAVLQEKYLGPYPNTYTFTKALGEYVIKDLCEGKIPTLIIRPSIVVSSMRDPVEGWIDNFNGPVGIMIACGKGLLRCSYLDSDIYANYIPVDVSIKALIVASWDLGLRQQKSQVVIVHCSNGCQKWISHGELINQSRIIGRDIPLNDTIWVPKGSTTRCRFYAYLCIILFHLLPAFFLDMVLKLAGKKPKLMKLQKKIYNATLQLRYFTFSEWDFSNKNFTALEEKILEKDRSDWSYDFRSEDVYKYLQICMLGVRKYLLYEFDDTLPKARKHYQRMYWLDKLTMFLLYGSFLWLVVHSGLIEKIIYKINNTLTYQFYGAFQSLLSQLF